MNMNTVTLCGVVKCGMTVPVLRLITKDPHATDLLHCIRHDLKRTRERAIHYVRLSGS